MDTKIECISFLFSEKEALQQYLNEQGWQGMRILPGFIVFERGDRQFYSVDLSPDFLRKKFKLLSSLQEQKELYEQFGYTCIGKNDFFVICSAKRQLTPFHSDIQIEEEAMNRIVNYYWKWKVAAKFIFFIIWPSSLLIRYNTNADNMYWLANETLLCALLFLLFSIPLCAKKMYLQVVKYRKGHKRSYQEVKQNNNIFVSYLVTSFCLFLYYWIYKSRILEDFVSFYLLSYSCFSLYLLSLRKGILSD